jgi:hypothetical protein
VKELQNNRTSSGDATTIGYFFFMSDNPTHALASAAYASILAQLLHIRRQDSAFMNKFVFAMSKATDGHEKATSLEVVDLLHICIRELESFYLIMDGIDECDDNQSLLRNLPLMAMHSNVKVLLLSRVNVASLNRLVPKSSQLAIDRSATSDDIRMYLTTQVDLMIDEELIPQTADLVDLVDHLVKGADGMFLWAKLMNTYLNSPALTPAMRMRTINTVILPEGLESMYNRILGLIAQGGRTEQDLARRIIMWLTHAIRPLNFIELHEALTMGEETSDSKYSNRFTDLRETISVVCGGLVEYYAGPSWQGGTSFRFIHLSVREYFATSLSFANGIVPSNYLAHSILTRSCLQHLIAISPKEQWSVEQGALVKSFKAYAVYHWMDHLAEISVQLSHSGVRNLPDFEDTVDQIVPTLDKFLETPTAISLWVDAYYSLTSQPLLNLMYKHPRFEQLQRFMTWTSCLPDQMKFSTQLRELCQKLHAFAFDMKVVIESWGEKLLQSPSTIWDEVSAFVKSPFLAGSSATIVTSLASNKPENSASSSNALCTISSTASNGKLNGVLSIWPSRAYEEQWKHLRPESPYSILLPLCTDWRARYQVWSNEQNPVCKFDIRIPLRETEISLQMRQSFRQESANDWKTSFALVISDDALSFVILRTLYRLCPATVNKAASFESTVIPIDLLPASSARWSEDLQAFDPSKLGIANLPPGLHFLHHDWYKYHWAFSRDGHYLFFSDCFGAPTMTQLAVFEVPGSGLLKIGLVGYSSFQTIFGRKHALVEKLAFHPKRSLLIYWNNNNLNLWNFKNRKLVIGLSV